MTLHWKLVVDAADPHTQADFWAAALGYVVEDNSVLINRLRSAGAIGPEITLEHGGRIAFEIWSPSGIRTIPTTPRAARGSAGASCSSGFRSGRRRRTGCTSTSTRHPEPGRPRSAVLSGSGRACCAKCKKQEASSR